MSTMDMDTAATAAATTITLTIGTDTGRQIDIMGSSVTTNTTITMNSMSSRNSSADITDHLAPTTQILHHNHAFAHLRVEAVTKPTGRAANAVIRRQACTDGRPCRMCAVGMCRPPCARATPKRALATPCDRQRDV
mmetsp:Transcript_22108/g.61509  ORF Transcript_22108/g.61509 Transcript_22108/m.61509 type:complete len:136 (+) Transcript_22108:895-1302(+)